MNRFMSRAAVAALVAGVLAGCGAAHQAPPTGPTAANLTATTLEVTEPPVPLARLQSILLTRGDLPSGFTPAPSNEPGDTTAGGPLRACGQMTVDTSGAAAQVTRTFVRSQDHLRLVLYVIDFPTAASASASVAGLGSLGRQCHQPGVTPTQPAAVGEEVAGLHQAVPQSLPAQQVNIVLIRSGPIVASIRLSAPAPSPTAGATMDAAVRAVGTKLAVGTGG